MLGMSYMYSDPFLSVCSLTLSNVISSKAIETICP